MPKTTKKQGRKSSATPKKRPPIAGVTPKSEKWLRVLVAVGLIVTVSLAWWGYKAMQTEKKFAQDKKQFAATEVSMQKVYEQMVATAGQPVEGHIVKSCAHTALEFQAGALYCGINYHFFYNIENEDGGERLSSQLAGIIKSGNSNVRSFSQEQILGGLIGKKEHYLFSLGDDFDCSLDYRFVEGASHNEAVDDVNRVSNFTHKTSATAVADYALSCISFPVKSVYSTNL